MNWAVPVVAIVPLALAGGCFGRGDEKPREDARGATKEVVELISALERATRGSDWRTVCGELFTRGARRRAGGKDCARLLRAAAGDVRGASIDVVKLRLREDYAEVVVRTRARGQPPLRDTVRVVREGGRYRIESLR